MTTREQLIREYEEALLAEREAWLRVLETESIPGPPSTWDAWLACADKVMAIGLQLNGRLPGTGPGPTD